MTKKLKKLLVFLLLICFSATTIAFASNELKEKIIIKSKAVKEEDVKSKVSKTKKNGLKTYELKEVKWEIEKVPELKKSYKLGENPKNEVIENDIRYRLKSSDKRSPTEIIEYRNKSDVKKEINSDKKKLFLSKLEEKDKKENIKIPGIFTGYENSPYYKYQGKIVKITGNKPVWNGYKDDVAKDIRKPGNLNITGAEFTGKIIKENGEIVRNAEYSGILTSKIYKATYEEELIATYEPVEKVTAEDIQGTLTYSLVNNYTKYVITSGLCVIGIAIAIILIILKRKSNKKID